ncbi:MAG: general secretion pathway protein GspB [Halioglobus sp.]
MSLILEALSRSRQEHQTEGAAPGLDTPVFVPDKAEGARWPSYIPWAGLLLALTVIAYLLLDTGTTPGPESVASRAPAGDEPAKLPTSAIKPQSSTTALSDKAAVVPAVERLPATSVASTVTTMKPAVTNAGLDDQAIAALYATQGRQDPSPTKAPAVASSPVSESADEPPQPVAAVKDVGNRSGSQQSIDLEAVLAQTEAELKNARLSEHSAPFINSLSQQTKDAIPSILYSRHDYSSTPGQSLVVLNGQTVRVGGSVRGGIKLDEILPDSIVLNHRGTQFRLRALNSWVNL